MTVRHLVAVVHDLLAADACLGPYLDEDTITIHGGADVCGQPFETHKLPAIRREQQPWPGDFCKAVVTFGRFSHFRDTFANRRDRSRAGWTFVIGIFVKSTVMPEELPGDTWAYDIYDHVLRILADDRPEDRLPCGSEILIARKDHEGDMLPLHFDGEIQAWKILTRFRWLVIGGTTRIPAPGCCDEVLVS